MKKIFILPTLLVIAALALTPAAAKPAQDPGAGLLFESFNDPIQYRLPDTPSDYYWWAIMDSDFLQYYGAPCDPENVVCATRETEAGDNFARFAKYHDYDFVGYNNVEFSELQTGYSYGEPARWCPSPGHPVVMTETMRFGTGHNVDGTGGAVGTAGGGLWNSYPDFPNQQLHPITAFWWSWGEYGTAFGALDGLAVNVFREGQIVSFQNVAAPIDPLEWMTWIMAWRTLPGGQEQIIFGVAQNGQVYDLGSVTTQPLGCLSVTNWNDNQFLQGFDQNGNPIPSFHNTPEGVDDYWDLTTLVVAQH